MLIDNWNINKLLAFVGGSHNGSAEMKMEANVSDLDNIISYVTL